MSGNWIPILKFVRDERKSRCRVGVSPPFGGRAIARSNDDGDEPRRAKALVLEFWPQVAQIL
jgi:hypothetical protein